ncbi:MAG: NUDIX hydrolase N-terminal domain-containing protein [Chloroflexi bacterium]|nr:NUDIX hydrolase N-terminal domain-containing protein [Chloroflexota bacterium]
MPDITQQLYLWIQQIQASAQTGLAFNPNAYDRERYEEFLKLAARMAATVNGNATLDAQLADALAQKWRAEVGEGIPGYVTPKVGVGAVVFNERDQVLLIKRVEGMWAMPTGWAEVGLSPAEVAAKEVREETGMLVTPLRVIGIYDVAKVRADYSPHFYSILFYCRLDGGELRPHPVETQGAGFFSRDQLPAPMSPHILARLELAWKIHRGEASPVWFDQ